MKIIFPVLLAVAFFLMPALQNESLLNAQVQTTVKGIVYHDKNENAVYDSGDDEPLEGVAVSNGRSVAITDSNGEYELPLRNDAAVFVV
ncbi:hypothetical protein GWN91_03740, partial [Candidatus Saccharibacteria bacterium]|nr:hypothetical protein [Candidatus Saccharibacteria bacterium]